MNKKKILLAYTEAFISVIPYVVLMAVSDLLSTLFLSLNGTNYFLRQDLFQLTQVALSDFFPFVLIISISFQLAKRYAISQPVIIFLSTAIFVCTEVWINSSHGVDTKVFINSSCLVLIIPLITIKALGYITPSINQYYWVGSELNTSLKYIYTSLITFCIIVSSLLLLEKTVSSIIYQNSLRFGVSDSYLFIIRTIATHILWFLGIHGANTFDTFFNSNFLNEYIFPTMSYKHFYDLFVIFGGSGAGLSLALTVFIFGKDEHSKKVAILSLPFVVFNINEVLIFGFPVIFNRKILIPFMTVPLVNITVAYFALSSFPIEITSANVPWITPIFINSYMATGGSIYALILQLVLLLLGVGIYRPFIKRYTLTQSLDLQRKKLSRTLNLPLLLKSKQGEESNEGVRATIHSNEEVASTISLLNDNKLTVYYQPKVNIKKEDCHHYEALLRLRMGDGSVRGPFFLPHIEIAGMAPIIDLWVCQKVRQHIVEWKEVSFTPKISINLHPDTLSNSDLILKIITIFHEYVNDVEFEIIERGLLDNKTATNNIMLLKEKEFSISMDDFGTGFSSLEHLCQFSIDTLKIDKGITDLIQTHRGYTICKNIVTLCNDMGYDCLIEGLETEEQMKTVLALGVTYVQGYYFSPAISKIKVREYKVNSNRFPREGQR